MDRQFVVVDKAIYIESLANWWMGLKEVFGRANIKSVWGLLFFLPLTLSVFFLQHLSSSFSLKPLFPIAICGTINRCLHLNLKSRLVILALVLHQALVFFLLYPEVLSLFSRTFSAAKVPFFVVDILDMNSTTYCRSTFLLCPCFACRLGLVCCFVTYRYVPGMMWMILCYQGQLYLIWL